VALRRLTLAIGRGGYFLPHPRNRVRVNIASDIASEPRADLFGRRTAWTRVIKSSRAGKDASSADIAMKWVLNVV
jgi:hypothetical protein